jgi:hypothetical protein
LGLLHLRRKHMSQQWTRDQSCLFCGRISCSNQ